MGKGNGNYFLFCLYTLRKMYEIFQVVPKHFRNYNNIFVYCIRFLKDSTNLAKDHMLIAQ